MVRAIFAYILSAVLSIYYTRTRGKSACPPPRCFSTLLARTSPNEMAWSFDIYGLGQRQHAHRRQARPERAFHHRAELNSALIYARHMHGQLRSAVAPRARAPRVFLLVVGTTVLQKAFMKGFSGDLEVEGARANQGGAHGDQRAHHGGVQLGGQDHEAAPALPVLLKGQIAGIGYGVAHGAVPAARALRAGAVVRCVASEAPISDFSKTIRVFMVSAETLTLAPDLIKAMHSVFETIDRRRPTTWTPQPSPIERPRGDVDATAVPDRAAQGRRGAQANRLLVPGPEPPCPYRQDARAGGVGWGPAGAARAPCGRSSSASTSPAPGACSRAARTSTKYNLKALRRVVPQEPFPFAGTIHDNIVRVQRRRRWWPRLAEQASSGSRCVAWASSASCAFSSTEGFAPELKDQPVMHRRHS